MARFLLKRAAGAFAILAATTLLTYLLIYLAPGDPAAVIVAQRTGKMPTAEQIAHLKTEYGLDRPPLIQYLAWTTQVARGDFGKSIRTGLPVVEEIGARLGATLLLAVVTTVFTLVAAIAGGFVMAIRENSAAARVIRSVTLLSVSMPNFWLGFLLILLFSVHLRWLPSHGMGDGRYLIMPVVVLGLPSAARLSQLTRSLLQQTRHQDYLRTARAKGQSERGMWLRHALPNIAVPLVTLSAMQFAHIAAGAIIIETLFAWPGVGNLYSIAVSGRDLPMIQALVLLFAGIFVLVNIVSDIAYVVIDPRIRLS